jgi:Ala-tRNA(Pro) deacylase
MSMSGTSTIHEFLGDAHVPYTVVPHRPAFTAQEEAAVTHVPGRKWAKVVVCFADGEPIQAVVPATSMVNLDRLQELTGGSEIRVAQEDELHRLFPGCDRGAVPPLGPIYGQLVFADVSLATEPEIVFSAGTHIDAIAMRWADFARTVKPIVGKFAAPSMDRVPEYHLSFRE